MNRAERRARIFTRPPSPKAAPAPAPDPTKQSSGISRISDELDDLLTGRAFTEVPFASRDEDLTAPTPFKDTTTGYNVEFTRAVCNNCGHNTFEFSRIWELHGERPALVVPRIPLSFNKVPTASIGGTRHVAMCGKCVKLAVE